MIARIESDYGVRIRIADPDNRKRYDINYLRTNSLEEVIDIVEFMTGQRCEVVRGN
ncbi:MAG: FecR domain-containing protein [Alistipes finegoldii]